MSEVTAYGEPFAANDSHVGAHLCRWTIYLHVSKSSCAREEEGFTPYQFALFTPEARWKPARKTHPLSCSRGFYNNAPALTTAAACKTAPQRGERLPHSLILQHARLPDEREKPAMAEQPSRTLKC